MARKHKSTSEQAVKDFRHAQARRENNPPARITPTCEVRGRRIHGYAYDPHLDPQLQLSSKAEHTSFEVDLASIHIHKRIFTKAILCAVRLPEPVQPRLFCETPLLRRNVKNEDLTHEPEQVKACRETRKLGI